MTRYSYEIQKGKGSNPDKTSSHIYEIDYSSLIETLGYSNIEKSAEDGENVY